MFDWLTNFFFSLPHETQFFMAAIALVATLLHARFHEKAASQGPTILTTIGIFATFIGIAMGLQRFDANNIQASVPYLLDGLKTAFWASVFGVGAALTLKIRDLMIGHKTSSQNSQIEDVSGADLLRGLQSINRALVGNEEASLITQIKLGRQDTNDRLDALKNAQLDALAKLSDMSSKVLVEALRDVIRDFNSKITEQFGDNFKELNSAVGELLVWQRQFKAHVETITEKMSKMSDTQHQATLNYAAVVENSSAFTQAANSLSSTIITINEEKARFVELSSQLAAAFSSASSGVIAIETKIIDISNQLESSHSKIAEAMIRAGNEHSAAVKTSIATAHDALTTGQKEFHKNIEEMNLKVQEQIKVLDRALEKALEDSLTSLGRQLTALSEKFVSDYEPLTDKLQRLVQIGKHA